MGCSLSVATKSHAHGLFSPVVPWSISHCRTCAEHPSKSAKQARWLNLDIGCKVEAYDALPGLGPCDRAQRIVNALNRNTLMKSTNSPSSPTPESLLTQPSSFEGRPSEAPRFDTGSVKGMATDAKRAANNALTQAKEKAASLAQEQKKSAADHIGRYGTALRDSARSVENEDPNIAYYASMAADRIERVADYVRSTDLDGLRRDAEDIARRHPVLFMGGMLLAGVVLGGLVKTTAKVIRDQGGASSEGDFSSPAYGAGDDLPNPVLDPESLAGGAGFAPNI